MSAADEFDRGRALDRSEPVRIMQNGEVLTVPYRKAVGLVSLGRAAWYNEPKKAREKPKKVSPSASETRAGTSGPGKSTVSVPAKSVEDDKTGYEPSLPDS